MSKEWNIKNEIWEHFNKALQTEHTMIEEDMLECMPRHINGDMNSELTKEVTMKEVKSAVYELGGTRAPGSDGFPGLFY